MTSSCLTNKTALSRCHTAKADSLPSNPYSHKCLEVQARDLARLSIPLFLPHNRGGLPWAIIMARVLALSP